MIYLKLKEHTFKMFIAYKYASLLGINICECTVDLFLPQVLDTDENIDQLTMETLMHLRKKMVMFMP